MCHDIFLMQKSGEHQQNNKRNDFVLLFLDSLNPFHHNHEVCILHMSNSSDIFILWFRIYLLWEANNHEIANKDCWLLKLIQINFGNLKGIREWWLEKVLSILNKPLSSSILGKMSQSWFLIEGKIKDDQNFMIVSLNLGQY